MHAVFVEVDVQDGVSVDEARKRLQENAPRMARQAGARAGYWLYPQADAASRWWFLTLKMRRKS